MTSPHGTSPTLVGLPKWPGELHDNIADYLDRRSIAAMTLVCRGIRQSFRTRLFESLEFTGNLWELSYRLHSFNRRIRRQGSLVQVFRKNTRYITLNIIGSYHLDYPSHYLPHGLKSFSRFFAVMRRLDGLIFSINNFNNAQVLRFSTLLRAIPLWTIPRALSLHVYVHPSNVNELARCFPRGILEAVGLPCRPTERNLIDLRASHPSIKALCLWEILNAAILGTIVEYFPRIESLVIDQSWLQREGTHHYRETTPLELDQLIQQLNGLCQLRRLCIGWEEESMHEFFISQYRACTCNDDYRKHSYSSTGYRDGDGLCEWYVTVILAVFRKLPRLKVVCVIGSGRVFYRGMEMATVQGGVDIERALLSDGDEQYRFPNVFV